MNKKLLNLVKKCNNDNNINDKLQKSMYNSNVNKITKEKYPYGEEHAIIRKTIYLLLEDLTKYGIDMTKYNEFFEYYNYVENEKNKIKTNL